MDFGNSQGPPAKKRRFFTDSSETSDPVLTPNGNARAKKENGANATPPNPILSTNSHDLAGTQPTENTISFDICTFEAFVGEKVAEDVLAVLREQSNDNLERAVNMYLDSAYKKFMKPGGLNPCSSKAPSPTTTRPAPLPAPRSMPSARYIGAFGVEGWATRSGANILKHGDTVLIERQKIQPPAPPKPKAKLGVPATPARNNTLASRRVDVIVRFTNESGMEIGRLAKDTANWVSTLLDQKICKFEGSVVYAPDKLRTNDTIFLQLKCSLLKSTFYNRSFQLADDRPQSPFDQAETADEKNLRLRQVALVRLFQEIGLQPTTANAAAKDDGRQGLLKAAEMDEEKQAEQKRSGATRSWDSPSSDTEEGKELEQDQLDALYKKAQSFDFDTPEAEPADTFAMTLRPYQKQSLHWMIAKEKDTRSNREPSMHPLWEEYVWPIKDHDDKDLPIISDVTKFYVNPYSGDLSLEFPIQEQHCLGGVLADEMGLGKTIQMLSLVHSHKSDIALQSRTANGGIATVNQLQRLSSSTPMQAAPCTTLVVAPMSLLSQWQSEAEKASKEGTIKVELYYGNEKSNNLQALCGSSNASMAPDLVITSYGVVLSEFSAIAARSGDKASHTGLFSLNFFRIILDEAHHIKNRSSKTARACYEMSATHRWVLTGTPIVNKLEDLFSLVRFLGVEPWNNFSFWKTFITVPFESGDFVRALNVVQTVLEPLVMRRTKDMKTPDGQPLVPLPPKQVDVVEVELSKTERDVYDFIYNRAKRTFNKNMEAGTVMKAFTTIFAQILRLRQSCCHPILVRNKDIVADEEEAGAVADANTGFADDMDLENLIQHFTAVTDEASKDNQVYGVHALSEIRDESDKECPFCFEEPMNDQTVTGCWHSACKRCLLDFMKHETDRGVVPKCFSCRAPLNARDLFEVMRHDDEVDMATGKPRISLQRLGMTSSSSKVAALISQLRSLRRDHPAMKSVVFSQFTSFLSLIEPALTRANVKFLRLDGGMAQKARAAVLTEFTERQGFTVLLISLRAGGVGLNLTSAGRVFMMDPWWSFAVEAQAIDRVHRLGQDDEVQVKRFIVKESVEERMLRIQERKKFIATSLGMMSDEEKKVQRIEDIKELLS
ncbi:DNA repair protein RAD5 [Cordyceps fumosorosea ARSEF 2679]|uniref:DNA repair protein RAD5 n=1 Tax=Cordyceps fumosorosea (strain ARSEF 2679) TaxID=1081104 RepID=A0A162JL08_CORFA|nr:DNA repair protein RAD5 [Cordyceps fumosorosea ARSEF 2679]OAA43573.1 DNA repair protein RAD5 [Cordyceps fumosorosea ARSEF 2679]